MNHKDLKKAQDVQQKEQKSFSTWLKGAKERGSRPRIIRNIIQPETQEVIDNMYGYYSEPKSNVETTNCVVNDCTHDWGGDINE